MRLTQSERRIWEAAYAAAFVREFYDELRLRHQTNSGGFDETIAAGHTEAAQTVADHVIHELRQWRAEETGNRIHGAPKVIVDGT